MNLVGLVIVSVVFGAAATLFARYLVAYVHLRGERMLTCPETGRHVGVDLDAGHAAIDTAMGKKPHLRLQNCTRWPERADCDQACLRQIENFPESFKVRDILESWYLGKNCVFCRKPFGTINWTDHKPALLSPELKTTEWSEISADALDQVLADHLPVCWNCHIAETFRREHPELITDRRYRKSDVREETSVH